MEHRHDGLAVIQCHLPVRGRHRLLDTALPAVKVTAPLLPRRLLRQPRIAAGRVGTHIRLGMSLLPPCRQLVVHIGALRRRLRLQRLLLEAGRHLAPHHPLQIRIQRHVLHRIAILHRQLHAAVLLSLRGLLLRRAVRHRLLRRGLPRRQIRAAEQQHRQHQRRRHRSPHTITSRNSL